MKKIKIIATLLVFVFAFNFFGCGDNNAKPLTSEQIYNNSKDCAVEIITYDKNNYELALGSGFVYSSDGKIVTNYHVIEKALSANVYIGETSYNVNNVLAYDIDKDLAVLKIDAVKLKTLKINYSAPATGATVYALGSSRGLTSTFSKGIVTTSSRELDGVQYIQHDAAISNGNSGGPLINDKGEIVGINTLTIKDSQNLNFAISASELKALDYSTPLTLAQVYDKECDAFRKLVNHIVANGEYDYENNNYFYSAGSDITSEGTFYSRSAFYYPDTDKISIALLWDSDLYFSITLVKNATSFSYGLLDFYFDYYMFGNIYPSTFSPYSSYLSYTNTNIPYNSKISSYRELAASSAQLLLACFNLDYMDIGITANELGFVNF